jgi:hypothetical protein
MTDILGTHGDPDSLFRVCFMFMPISECRMAGWLVNTELERIGKEIIVVHPGIRLEGLWKNTKNPSSQDSCVQAEVQTQHVSNTSLEPCGHNLLLATHIYTVRQFTFGFRRHVKSTVTMQAAHSWEGYEIYSAATWRQKSTEKGETFQYISFENEKIAILHFHVLVCPTYAYVNSPLRGEICIYLWLYSPCGLRPLFPVLYPYTVGWTPWTGDQPVTRPLPTHRTTQTQKKRTDRHPCLEWFRTHDPSVPVGEDGSCLRPRDH